MNAFVIYFNARARVRLCRERACVCVCEWVLAHSCTLSCITSSIEEFHFHASTSSLHTAPCHAHMSEFIGLLTNENFHIDSSSLQIERWFLFCRVYERSPRSCKWDSNVALHTALKYALELYRWLIKRQQQKQLRHSTTTAQMKRKVTFVHESCFFSHEKHSLIFMRISLLLRRHKLRRVFHVQTNNCHCIVGL